MYVFIACIYVQRVLKKKKNNLKHVYKIIQILYMHSIKLNLQCTYIQKVLKKKKK